ncbi:MAG: uroporphyrinogen decarboxylase family protein [Elusimicrobiota bacterium]
MIPKERMLTAMRNGKPDYVPVAPDMSNMIPCRLTKKPFWDIYLYNNPPKWKAYIDAVKYFGFDGWLEAVPVSYSPEPVPELLPSLWKEAIILKTDDRIYTRNHRTVSGKEEWSRTCNVYYIDNSPTHGVELSKLGMPTTTPTEWEDVKKVNNYKGTDAFYEAYEYMGDRGVVGLAVQMPGLNIKNPDSVYEYYDNPKKVIARCEKQTENAIATLKKHLELKPDFILIGNSGHMLSNPPPIFRDLSLYALKEFSKLCKSAGIPSQVHCCGPEYQLVKIAAEESDLSSINPLEIPPMGDCDLAKVKKEFGNKISLMGNLHTTDVMLRGSVKDVENAAKAAIDAAAHDGGFILSTGDQCGRDTPDENIFAMIETGRKYGKY